VKAKACQDTLSHSPDSNINQVLSTCLQVVTKTIDRKAFVSLICFIYKDKIVCMSCSALTLRAANPQDFWTEHTAEIS
jgi:hypothetical protein